MQLVTLFTTHYYIYIMLLLTVCLESIVVVVNDYMCDVLVAILRIVLCAIERSLWLARFYHVGG